MGYYATKERPSAPVGDRIYIYFIFFNCLVLQMKYIFPET